MHHSDLTTSLLASQQSVEVVFIAKASTIGKSLAPASSDVVKKPEEESPTGTSVSGEATDIAWAWKYCREEYRCNASPIKNHKHNTH